MFESKTKKNVRANIKAACFVLAGLFLGGTATAQDLKLEAPTTLETSYSLGHKAKGGFLFDEKSQESIAEKLVTSFSIQINSAGNYFLTSQALGVSDAASTLQEIKVYVDKQYLGVLNLKKDGWQAVGIKGEKTFFLSQGKHTISYETTAQHYPEVDMIKLSTDVANAKIDMSAFDNYIEELQANGEKNLHVKEKIEVDYEKMQSTAKSAAHPWMVTPYTLSNPKGNYTNLMNVPLVYTYFKKVRLTAGQKVTFRTAPISGQDNNSVDPVMYLYSTKTFGHAWQNDDHTGRQSRISITVPTTGDYFLVLRAYSNSYASTQRGAQGVVKVYQNNTLLNGKAPVSGYMVDVSTSNNGVLNYFTANRRGRAKLWLQIGSQIRSLSLTYQWNNNARLKYRKNTTTNQNLNLLVGSFNTNIKQSFGRCDVYGSCKTASSTVVNNFPNLTAANAIQSAPSTRVYNCASWAAGLTQGWFWGRMYASNQGGTCTNCPSQHNYGGAQVWSTWDAFFGNNPARYVGAQSYSRNGSSGQVAVWKKGSDITHFSVCAKANKHPHGYAWESKPGSLERTFHQKNDLRGPSYGSIATYYKKRGKSLAENADGKLFSFEESVKNGLTVIQKVELTAKERETLEQYNNKETNTQFDQLYKEWIAQCKSPEFMANSNPYVFFTTKEAKALVALAKEDQDANLFYFGDKIFDLAENSFESEMSSLLFCMVNTETYGHLMQEVKKEWKANNYTANGAYIAPLAITNTKNYIKKILAEKGRTQIYTTINDDLAVANNNDNYRIYPNPVKDESQITFTLTTSAPVALVIYDVKGNIVKTLANNEVLEKGDYAYKINAANFNSGIYFCKLTVNNDVLTRKFLVQH